MPFEFYIEKFQDLNSAGEKISLILAFTAQNCLKAFDGVHFNEIGY